MNNLRSKSSKIFALVWAFALLFQVAFPVTSFALSSGPTQPETQGFQPASSDNMVDLFTGDFKYNIPLFDLDGYPVNLSYQSQISMEEEASWVGLGWSLNPGTINREMRGLPDDFKGDIIKKETNIKDNITFGITGTLAGEIAGLNVTPFSPRLSLFYNNYKGWGYEMSASLNQSLGKTNQDKTQNMGQLDLSYNSQSGVDVGIGFSHMYNKNDKENLNFSLGVNSREGLKGLTLTNQVINSSSKDKELVKTSGGLTFGTGSYTPAPKSTYITTPVNVEFAAGAEAIIFHPNSRIGGYFNNQQLAEKKIEQASFGYFNSTAGEKGNEKNVLDYNEEPLSVPYSRKMKKLPMIYGTYDLFNVSGQGLSAQFKSVRGDIGTFRDASVASGTAGVSVGIDIGVGTAAHTSADISVPISLQKSGKWKIENDLNGKIPFTQNENNSLYEPVTLKDAGEPIPVANAAFYDAIGNTSAIYGKLNKFPISANLKNGFKSEINQQNSQELPALNNVLKKTNRDRRNTVFSYLNARQAALFALDKTIKSYNYTTNNSTTCGTTVTEISRLTKKGHHISEISVTNSNGLRYVYGIPVYNQRQKDVTFSVNKNSEKLNNSFIKYEHGEDNSTTNTQGLDHYYEAKIVPGYASSFLLTGILSPDYVDKTYNGITDDDAGSATKFNYTKKTSANNDYKWRTPANPANADANKSFAKWLPGNKSDQLDQSYPDSKSDDKATYSYGERELWYMHSIESKNYIARFYTSDRTDGLGIKENGQVDAGGPKLQKLDKIEIYSKAEIDRVSGGGTPVPLKTVHFKYATPNESLCPGIPNSSVVGGGKLTLTQVYFTYGNNARGATNIYKFEYNSGYNNGTQTIPFAYNPVNVDRWGVFKDKINFAYPDNQDFPFTLQPASGLMTNALLDEYASAWSLNKITLPTGAELTVDYESDSYAYVMNKRAGQYIFIKGFSASGNSTSNNPNLYSLTSGINHYIHLNLPVPVNSKEEFEQLYMPDVKQIYFDCTVKLTTSSTSKERVTGFAELDGDNITWISPNEVALKLKTVDGDRGVNLQPICKAALMKLRNELPELAFGNEVPTFGAPGSNNFTEIKKLIKGVYPYSQDILDLLRGFDKVRTSDGWASEVNVDNDSWVRLACPNFTKYGGGSRVKKVSIYDKWAEMVNGSGHTSSSYATTYDYSIDSPLQGGAPISSGVASYEPIWGNEENLMREPLNYKEKRTLLGPRNKSYQIAPVGEVLFPAPVVGYSKVTVRTQPGNPDPANRRTGAGYSVHEFYTAKDFPTKSDYTRLHYNRVPANPVFKLLINVSLEKMAMSQGFCVEVNDMHGKPKSDKTYNEMGGLITSTEYKYKMLDGNLSNLVDMVTPQGNITPGTLGLDIDIWQDMSEEFAFATTIGTTIGADVPPAPISIPHVLVIQQLNANTLRTAVTTKFIKRFGILDEVIHSENGATVNTKNVLFDSETGDVLLTKTTGEYSDSPIYEFKYPAHWAYDEGMGMAYKNQDLILYNVAINNTNGQITDAAALNLLNHGDEILVFEDLDIEKEKLEVTLGKAKLQPYFLNKVSTSPGSEVGYLIDFTGQKLTNLDDNTVTLRVKRSARKNMASVAIGAFNALVNPISIPDGKIVVNTNNNVLNASAATFKNKWQIPTAYRMLNCTTTPQDWCPIICGTSVSNSTKNWYAQAGDNVTLCSIAPNITLDGTPCANIPFYALQPEPPFGLTHFYQAQVGNCILTITREDGGYFNLDELECGGGSGGGGGTKAAPGNNPACSVTYQGHPMVITLECSNCEESPCDAPNPALASSDRINPFYEGTLGNWRMDKTYAFDDKNTRNYTQTGVKNQGYYTTFSPFWSWSNNKLVPNATNWVEANTITKYDKAGNPIEEKNALGLFSAALFGYRNALPIARSNNAKYTQIAYEGFEEFKVTPNAVCLRPSCNPVHFPYDLLPAMNKPILSTEQAHTGKYSMKLSNANQSITFNGGVESTSSLDFSLSNTSGLFTLGETANLGTFQPISPNASRTYVVSAWVYSNQFNCNSNVRQNPPQILNINNSSIQLPNGGKPVGPVIDGWRKIEETITIPSNLTNVNLTFSFASELGTMYVDDVRVHPYDGSMEIFAYDPFSLRLMATLDDRNYATFYEYDDAGLLIRVKRETEKGVATIQESRSFIKPNN